MTFCHQSTGVAVLVPAEKGVFISEEAVDVLSERVKFVKMECPGYAKVEFNCSTSENLTVFGSGSRLNVFPDGYYILHHSGGGRMEVDTVGTMVSGYVLPFYTYTSFECKVLYLSG